MQKIKSYTEEVEQNRSPTPAAIIQSNDDALPEYRGPSLLLERSMCRKHDVTGERTGPELPQPI